MDPNEVVGAGHRGPARLGDSARTELTSDPHGASGDPPPSFRLQLRFTDVICNCSEMLCDSRRWMCVTGNRLSPAWWRLPAIPQTQGSLLAATCRAWCAADRLG